MFEQRKLLRAVERGDLDEIKTILQDEDGGCKGCAGTASLSQACTMNRRDIVELLLEHGASPNYLHCHSHIVPANTFSDLLTERTSNETSHLQRELAVNENDLHTSSVSNANDANAARYAVNGNNSHTPLSGNGNDDSVNGDIRTGHVINDNLLSVPVTTTNDNLHPSIQCSNGDHCVFRQSSVNTEISMHDGTRAVLPSFRLLRFPLSVACNTRHINFNIVRQLVESGADVNAEDVSGLTALHIASEMQGQDLVKYLLQHNADVNSMNNSQGQSALALACSISNDPLVIQILIEAGSDVNAMDMCGRYPLNEAILNPFIGHKVVQLLLDAGADVTQDYFMSSATTEGTCSTMEALHRHGAVVDPMFLGKGALHVACERTSVSVDRLLLLLRWGADVNRICPFGLKPMEYACQDFQLEKVRVLMGWGADLNLLGYLTGPCWLWHLDWFNQYIALINLLVAGGLHVNHSLCQTLAVCVGRLPGRKGLRSKVTQFLKNLPENPPTLKNLCRLALRRCLSPKTDENIEKLVMLPLSIRLFLCLKENTYATNHSLSQPKQSDITAL